MPASQHQSPKSDIEISQAASKRRILEVAKERLGIEADNLDPYGHYKAKVSMDFVKSLKDKKNGKLILVTAISPTPAGEGKTTTTVGLTDALNHIGKKAMLCLREPSLGPSFGMKGGAAGGGYAQVIPMEDINLHFTGDFHAITSAHNLLAALVDNHIYWGNALGIDSRRVAWRRVMDMNDRALREIVCSLGGVANGYPREAGFDITVASEVMAIFCLAKDLDDLKTRLGNIIVALYARPQTGARPRPQRPRRHGGAAEGRDRAQPGADAGRHARLRPWRAVRQHRAWLQFGVGDDHRAEARRLRRHRGRLRRRSRCGEIPRHQVPQGRAEAGLRRGRGDHPRAEDAWRREEGGPEEGEPRGAGKRHEQPAAPHREHQEIQPARRRLDQPFLGRHRRRDRAGEGEVQGARRRGADGRPLGDGRRGRGRRRARGREGDRRGQGEPEAALSATTCRCSTRCAPSPRRSTAPTTRPPTSR